MHKNLSDCIVMGSVLLLMAGCQSDSPNVAMSRHIGPEPFEIVNGTNMGSRLFDVSLITEDEVNSVVPRRLAPSSPVAATSDIPVGPLNVNDAVARAVAHNPTIAVLRKAVDVAVQNRRAATDITDPELSVEWGEGESDSRSTSWGTEESRTTQQSEQTSSGTQIQSSPGMPDSYESSSSSASSSSSSREQQTSQSSSTGWDESDGYQIGLRFYLPNPWLMSPSVAARKAEILAAEADLQDAERLLAIEVRRLFVELEHLYHDLKSCDKVLRLNNKLVAAVRERADQGQSTGLDILDAERSRMKAESDRAQLWQDYVQARRELADLLDLPPQSMHIVTTPLNMDHLQVELTESVVEQIDQLAQHSRPDLAALSYRTLAARNAYRSVRNERIPWVSHIDASYGEGSQTSWGSGTESSTSYETGSGTRTDTGYSQDYDTSGAATGDSTSDQEYTTSSESSRQSSTGSFGSSDDEESSEWSIGFAINVPIFSLLWNDEANATRAEYRLAEASYEQGHFQVSRDVHNAAYLLEAVRKDYLRHWTQAQPFIAEMQDMESSTEEDGDLSIDEIVTIQLRVVDAQRLLRNMKRRYCLAVVELEGATGAPFDVLLRAANGQTPEPLPLEPEPVPDVTEAPESVPAAAALTDGE